MFEQEADMHIKNTHAHTHTHTHTHTNTHKRARALKRTFRLTTDAAGKALDVENVVHGLASSGFSGDFPATFGAHA